MEDYQKRFSEFLANSGALFFKEGFILKDGRPTPYFVNSRVSWSGKSPSTTVLYLLFISVTSVPNAIFILL